MVTQSTRSLDTTKVKFIMQCTCISLCSSCMWTAVTAKPPKKIPRHVPLHLRKKMKQKPPPNFFEVSPSSGVLLPGKTTDIKIIFMPSEEVYNKCMCIIMCLRVSTCTCNLSRSVILPIIIHVTT